MAFGKPYVPPGGMAAHSQQTIAAKFSQAVGKAARSTYRSKSKRVRIGPGRSLVRQSSKGLKRISKRSLASKRRKVPKARKAKRAHLVKGSQAAKRYMASIRRKKK